MWKEAALLNSFVEVLFEKNVSEMTIETLIGKQA
jgi:hypothetical protein